MVSMREWQRPSAGKFRVGCFALSDAPGFARGQQTAYCPAAAAELSLQAESSSRVFKQASQAWQGWWGMTKAQTSDVFLRLLRRSSSVIIEAHRGGHGQARLHRYREEGQLTLP